MVCLRKDWVLGRNGDLPERARQDRTTNSTNRMNTKRRTRIKSTGKQAWIAAQTGYTSIYSDQEVAKILTLLKGSGSVELKVVVPMPTHRATIQTIGLDPVEA